MIKIEYECEVLTPMVVQGAVSNKKADDLIVRVPSVKGMMRFWWRVFQPENSTKELRNHEGKLFGCIGAKGESTKSNVRIRTHIIKQYRENEVDLFPYKDDKNRNKKDWRYTGLGKGTLFKVELVFCETIYRAEEDEDKKVITSQVYEDTFETMALLGGLGLRSRRGFGAFRIVNKTKISFEKQEQRKEAKSWLKIGDVLNRINKIDKWNCLHVKKIVVIQKEFSNIEQTLKAIDGASHNIRKRLGTEYEKNLINEALGAGIGRKASPLYMSVFQEEQHYRIVITLLEEKKDTRLQEIQERFIKQIRRQYEQ